MALPALQKTWEHSVNIAAASSTADETDVDETLLAMKNALVDGVTFTAPWSIVSSSNGTTADASDNWTTIADIVHNTAGNAHSWIVLEAPVGDVQICLNTGWNNTIPERIEVVVSLSGAFTGGSTTNRPTASDEVIASTSTTNILPTTTFNSTVHCSISDDGEQTRLFVMISGVVYITLIVGELADTPTGLTDPSFVIYAGVGSASDMLSISNIWNNCVLRCNDGGAFTVRLSGEAVQVGTTAGSFDLFSSYPVDNAFSAEWHMGPVGVWGVSGSPQAGKVGNLPDVWWGQENVNTGDQYPSTGTLYQFVQLGDLIFPWDSTTVALTS